MANSRQVHDVCEQKGPAFEAAEARGADIAMCSRPVGPRREFETREAG